MSTAVITSTFRPSIFSPSGLAYHPVLMSDTTSFKLPIAALIAISCFVGLVAGTLVFAVHRLYHTHRKNAKGRSRSFMLPKLRFNTTPATLLQHPTFGIASPTAAYDIALPASPLQPQHGGSFWSAFKKIPSANGFAHRYDPELGLNQCTVLEGEPGRVAQTEPLHIPSMAREHPISHSYIALRRPPLRSNTTTTFKSYAPEISSGLCNEILRVLARSPGSHLPPRRIAKKSEFPLAMNEEFEYVKYRLRELTRTRLAQANVKLFPVMGPPKPLEVLPTVAFLAAGAADLRPDPVKSMPSHPDIEKKPTTAPRCPVLASVKNDKCSTVQVPPKTSPTPQVPTLKAQEVLKNGSKLFPVQGPLKGLEAPPRSPKGSAIDVRPANAGNKLFPVQGPIRPLEVVSPRTSKGGAILVDSKHDFSVPVGPSQSFTSVPRRGSTAKPLSCRSSVTTSSRMSSVNQNSPVKVKKPFY